jgi:hypothetical protein
MEGTTPAYPVLDYGDRMTIDLGGQWKFVKPDLIRHPGE